MIDIYWDDLTPEKQAEILKTWDGDNGNYDVFPICSLPEYEGECDSR